MHATATFLMNLGQALAAQTLYSEGHPMRAAARERARASLLPVLDDGVLRVSFLDGAVIVGSRIMAELRGWDWGPKLAAAGVQRLEIDASPTPTLADIEALIIELLARLQHGADHDATIATHGFRFGPFGVSAGGGGGGGGDLEGALDRSERAMSDLFDALAQLPMTEEASAVRWIHDEVASGAEVPMAEVEAVVQSLSMAIHRDEHVLLPLLELKRFDQYTTTHSCNVAMLSIGLAEQLGLSGNDARAIGTAALLHDIGKVRVPPEVLVKPGKLTDAEFALMRAHPVDGARILGERSRGHALAATVAYEHHIWENGQGGYPLSRWPHPCHYASRLVHVCDLYDALSTNRPYRDAWPRAKTIGMLQGQAGVETDKEMVRAFVELLGRSMETRSMIEEERNASGWSNDVAVTASQMYPDAAAVA